MHDRSINPQIIIDARAAGPGYNKLMSLNNKQLLKWVNENLNDEGFPNKKRLLKKIRENNLNGYDFIYNLEESDWDQLEIDKEKLSELLTNFNNNYISEPLLDKLKDLNLKEKVAGLNEDGLKSLGYQGWKDRGATDSNIKVLIDEN